MSDELRQAIERVAGRFRLVRLHGGLAVCWLGWAVVSLGLGAYSRSVPGAGLPPGRVLAAVAAFSAATALVWWLLSSRGVRDRRWVARRIEAAHPELGTGLLAAVEEDAAADGKLGFLQSAVVREVLDHRRLRGWDDAVPERRLVGVRVADAAALALLLASALILLNRARTRADAPPPTLLAPADVADVSVDPGDAEIERGSTLLVVARFNGSVPPDAGLVVLPAAAEGPEARTAMARSLEDPTFAGRVESVAADLSYRVEFQGRKTPTYRVRVFEYPELLRTDAALVFPSYTDLEPKTVEDVRHVTAVEGTELTLLCRLNKTVAAATLVDAEGRSVPLTPAPAGDHVYKTTFTLADPKRFKVQLVDREGRTNRLTPEIVVNVTRNRPPMVTMTRPSHDVRVSPVEELSLEARLDDDYGVVRHGMTYTLAGRPPTEVAFKDPGPKATRVKAAHLLEFETLKASPDDLVTYVFWAEDVGPDGKPRRSSGDLFFAEVRHFEEVFRQGEAPPSGSSETEQEGQQGNGQEAEKLAELQKQVINGTWKLLRRETGASLSPAFAADAELLKESQASALEQAEALAEKLTDAKSKASLDQATTFMKEAGTQLGRAETGPALAPFTPALTAEQGAYAALLKLRAREFEVVRSNRRQQQSGRSSSASQSQRQLQQLELKDDENRYEEQSAAKAQTRAEQEQRETRQVVNRLRELAQRQNDLNERVKELQSALEAAKTPEAREEIGRQLKRLRDQQREVLRDTDELRERMEREENRDRMAEARRQVEEGREHVRQASEALEQGRLPQALTEGARAGRQLNDLREELRKQSSEKFAEEMTGMRDQARKLDDDQKAITERLDAENGNARPGLRDTRSDQVRQGLEQQRKKLDQILDRIKATVQDAEETEPLLAKNLFDTARKATEQKVPDALRVAEELEKAGIPEEAVKASKHAGRGIAELRKGVERAAENVLGDETAALRRAQNELDALSEQINRELALASGRTPVPPRPGAQGQPQPGQRPDGERQNGTQTPPQGEPGQEQGDPAHPKAQPGRDGSSQAQNAQPKGQGQPEGQPGQAKGQQGQGQGQQAPQGQQGQGQQGEGQPGQARPPGRQGQGPLRGGNPTRAGGGGGGGREGGLDRLLEGVPSGPGGPITGEGFRQWSDRMRDVEELLNDPQLRSEAARIRDRVRGEREEFKRHAKEPDPNRLREMVADPIRELRTRVAEEVRRRESPDSLVPIDRDPVPPQYAEGVRRYYERLGSGR